MQLDFYSKGKRYFALPFSDVTTGNINSKKDRENVSQENILYSDSNKNLQICNNLKGNETTFNAGEYFMVRSYFFLRKNASFF